MIPEQSQVSQMESFESWLVVIGQRMWAGVTERDGASNRHACETYLRLGQRILAQATDPRDEPFSGPTFPQE